MITKEKKTYITTILLTIILLAFIFVQNFLSFYRNAVSEAEALGGSCLTAETMQLEAYINRSMNTLKVVADNVEYMLADGASTEEIENYLVSASDAYIRDVDENCTGIYGWVNGEYVDGVGWVPDEDYVPTERTWYKDAVTASGEIAIVPPYVDAQTGDVIISLARLLSDDSSVLSFDLVLNNVQNITKNINLNDKGYGFILSDSGLVIAHFDENMRGTNFFDDPSMADFAREIVRAENGSFVYNVDGEKSTVFVSTIFGSWHIVMVVSNEKLLGGFLNVLVRDIVISIGIIAIIILFYTYTFRKMNDLLTREEKSIATTEKLNNDIVRALAHTIDAKDRYTSGHSQRVAEYSLEIAKRIGKSEEEQRKIYYAGLLHDVGKIRVPEEVINKPGKLTEDEFSQIKIHPIVSYHILKDIYEDKILADGAKCHHERYDGKGYPNGLGGENIPEVARIIGVADAYDAMASNRSYRTVLPQEVVRAEIEKGIGKQFDPVFAGIMLQMIDEDKEYKMCESESANKNILVVDDDIYVHEMIVAFTEPVPTYKVTCVLSGEEALKAVSETRYDMVFLDIIMPGMDGFETLKKIKEISDVPVVFLTGDRNDEVIAAVTSAEVEDYLIKPFMPVVLREVMHSVMNG